MKLKIHFHCIKKLSKMNIQERRQLGHRQGLTEVLSKPGHITSEKPVQSPQPSPACLSSTEEDHTVALLSQPGPRVTVWTCTPMPHKGRAEQAKETFCYVSL